VENQDDIETGDETPLKKIVVTTISALR